MLASHHIDGGKYAKVVEGDILANAVVGISRTAKTTTALHGEVTPASVRY